MVRQVDGSVFADPAVFDKKVSLLYLHAGTVSLDEGIHKNAESLHQALQEAGIKNVVFRDAGMGFARMANLALRPVRLCAAAVPGEKVIGSLCQNRGHVTRQWCRG